MDITPAAEEYHRHFFPNTELLREDDPDLAQIIENFAFDEVPNEPGVNDLDDRTRYMAILATLLGAQCLTEFRGIVPAALTAGVTPVEAKEITYQAVAYLGIARVYPFLAALNDVLRERGVKLPLESQSTTTAEDRREKGTQAQVDIFGDGMKDFYKSGPAEKRHINRWLAANCFGDYYTRTGLDLKQREMITFCFIAAQGGCEPQLTAHAAANIRLGNDRAFLISVVSQCLPYIGYPRSLNALRCVDNAAQSAA
ncbi:carboxymuconolactone decarboxylase family protein [Bifidobacterium vansinderenii]|uniref:Carboxymuconolactone decarboxylase n=1 Tax=Bifidobacterium vansinderenii TaxID=1984871 RepID=A0A229VWU3_9BIFI|nr:carboxymuconolactone decarboxylase family protein [Bifidobacterium vansinderenii]OXN00094.1 carboxymuconolactone decarboxylase [Bifidobacterium vansinderenii]